MSSMRGFFDEALKINLVNTRYINTTLHVTSSLRTCKLGMMMIRTL